MWYHTNPRTRLGLWTVTRKWSLKTSTQFDRRVGLDPVSTSQESEIKLERYHITEGSVSGLVTVAGLATAYPCQQMSYNLQPSSRLPPRYIYNDRIHEWLVSVFRIGISCSKTHGLESIDDKRCSGRDAPLLFACKHIEEQRKRGALARAWQMFCSIYYPCVQKKKIGGSRQ